MSLKKQSLADKISDILTTKPQNADTDDEDESQAKLPEHIVEDDDEIQSESTFRKQNVTLLDDLDERYAGKSSSRKKLEPESDSLSDGEDSELAEKDSNAEITSESDIESDSDDDNNEDSESNEEIEGEFKHLEESKGKKTAQQTGHCVRNQLSLWESLLEMRIQLQKCLIPANKMPHTAVFDELLTDSPEFSSKATVTAKTISGTLDKLLDLQDLLSQQFKETKHIYKRDSTKGKSEQKPELSDEEIPSDTDEEMDKSGEEVLPTKKLKLDYKTELNRRHTLHRDYRNATIQKWNDKTRLAANKSSLANHSVVNQIEHNLSDKARLIRKTQLRRSKYNIIGESPPEQEDSKNDEETAPRITEEYNCNIFDDDDFYHHLLRELIEVKSADLTDPVQLGRQWIQLQHLRSKMKRKIDTRATKGRKIRYAVHSKLVNYMAPIDDSMWTDEAKNELYSSLFGKNK